MTKEEADQIVKDIMRKNKEESLKEMARTPKEPFIGKIEWDPNERKRLIEKRLVDKVNDDWFREWRER